MTWDGDQLVAELALNLPVLDNADNAAIDLWVSPAHRRRGIGGQLLEHGLRRARADNRRRVVLHINEDGPPVPGGRPGVPFLQARGATKALVDVRRRVDLATVDLADYERLRAEAAVASTAYRLETWVTVIPDDLIDGIGALETRMVLDAPMGDLPWEAEQYDAARLREAERVLIARGRRTYGVAAVHMDSGVVAGYTQCGIARDVPQHAWQWATIVLPDHRGHRLGLRLKTELMITMCDAEPQLQTMDTFNAASNEHMIAINDRMGFVPLDVWSDWQLDLAP